MRRHAANDRVNKLGHLHHGPMTGDNAGIRRNRRPAGELAKPFQVRLAADLAAEMRQAARASGNLSYSLYVERMAATLRDENGQLPVFTDDAEAHTAAA